MLPGHGLGSYAYKERKGDFYMINIGVLGCGKIAQVRHIPEYAANADCKLIGFYNPTKSRALEMAEKYGGTAYDSAEELLANPEIDAVSVCAANYAHAELAIAALKAGKHVLCEKPMATTPEDCEAMLRAEKESGKRLLIGQNQRFALAHQKAKELIDSGFIGRVVTFRTAFGHGGPETWSIKPGKDTWFFDKQRAAMGAMADLGVHKTDAIRYMLGQDVAKVTAKLATLDKCGTDGELIGVDDNAVCIYEMTGGAIGTMTASWTYYGAEDNSTAFYGTKGIMRIYDDPEHSIVCIMADGSKEVFDVDAIQTNDNQTSSGVIDEFISAISEDRPSLLDADKVIGSMKAVFAAIESNKTGKPVEVK